MDLFTPFGLVLDILGVVLLFYYGLPSKMKSETPNMTFHTGNKEMDKIAKTNKAVKFWSYSGLSLLILGFAFQIVGWIYQSTLCKIPECFYDQYKIPILILPNL